MVKVVTFSKFGGPEMLEYQDVKMPSLKPGEIRIRNVAMGLNYIDIDILAGRYDDVKLPSGLGFEGCGIIEETEGDVGEFKKNDLVCYFAGSLYPYGAFAEERILHHSLVFAVPKNIEPEEVVSLLFKGMAAHYLATRVSIANENTFALVHAAAGGVGMILTNYIKSYGGKVIGTVGSDNKVEFAKKNGCDFVINYAKEDFVKKALEYTNGYGVTDAFDGVGVDTLEKTIDCVRAFGFLVNYGHCSGVVKNINMDLIRKNSIFLTAPNIFHYKKNRMEALLTYHDIFDLLQKGVIKDNINIKYRFDEIPTALKDIAARRTIGSNIVTF